MLIINEEYLANSNLLNNSNLLLVNETADSDRFEAKCTRYLKKNYPDHKFTLKGGNNNQESDILVDDKFYIECKMTENGKKKNGSQSTGFSIKLNEAGNKFECAEYLDSNTDLIMNDINNNFDQCIKLLKPHSKTYSIQLDQKVFAQWIYNYYTGKNVKFIFTVYKGKNVIFKNTVSNILKYFNILADVRYVKYGTKVLPNYLYDEVINSLKHKYKSLHIKNNKDENDRNTVVTINSDIEDPYININDYTIYLSSNTDNDNEYKLMKVSKYGTARVVFTLHSKLEQDIKDLNAFNNYLNK